MSARRIVVVGGGITGLAAARTLATHPSSPQVVVVEASERLGGKILTTPFAGLPAVDEGPDSLLARVPEAVELCQALGLGDQLVSPETGTASVWWDGTLHPLPAGLVLGVPAGLGGLARSRLLSWKGKARAALEPTVPRYDPADDLGMLLRRRFGNEVVDRLVGPLVGGINAGDPDGMSLAVVTPQLAEAARHHRSLLVGLRASVRERPTGERVFVTPRQGIGALVDRLAADLDRRGVTLRLGAPVEGLEPLSGDRWRVAGHEADAVVLALPAAMAATLLASPAPDVAADLSSLKAVSVALVTLAFPDAALPDRSVGSGYLVPRGQQRTITACSFGSAKWGHWRRSDQTVLRVSAGRAGAEEAAWLPDEVLVARVLDDLRLHVGLRGDPTAVRISRWPASLPQYAPGHLDRVADADRRLAHAAPGVVLAGATYRGVGIPSCIRDGARAARSVLGTAA